ncbi:MAG: hypothetical protein ACLP5H_23920 [Desulfomonilaceae bacterium]
MNIPWDGLPHLQNFFQLDFLFSGLQVSSTEIYLARLGVLLIFGAGLIWVGFKILMKVLDCVQTFLGSLSALPKSFFLLLLLVIPLSTNSLGAKWIGYILLVLCLLGLAGTAALVLVLWKYGVDQGLRLINSFRSRSEGLPHDSKISSSPPDNIVTPVMNSPIVRSV